MQTNNKIMALPYMIITDCGYETSIINVGGPGEAGMGALAQ